LQTHELPPLVLSLLFLLVLLANKKPDPSYDCIEVIFGNPAFPFLYGTRDFPSLPHGSFGFFYLHTKNVRDV